MMILTHDMPFLERVVDAKEKEAKRMWAQIPEIRIENWGNQDVAKANRAQAAHATALLLGGQDLTWAADIMKQHPQNIRMLIEREGEGYRTKTEIRYRPE
jgi:hypothetical protein